MAGVAELDEIFEPAKYTWLFLDRAPAPLNSRVASEGTERQIRWLPFRFLDQRILEAAHADKNAPDVVAVMGGRYEVQRRSGLLVDRYATTPPTEDREVRRGLWFRQSRMGWEPYEVEKDALIEKVFLELRGQACPEHKVDMEATVRFTTDETMPVVSLRFTVESPSAWSWPVAMDTVAGRESSTRWTMQAAEVRPSTSWLSLSSSVEVKRGYGRIELEEGEAEEEALSDEIGDHLFVLLHGVGEGMWASDGNGMKEQAKTLRANMHELQLRAAGFVKDGDAWRTLNGKAPVVRKHEVINAEWYHVIHTEELDERVRAITLSSVGNLRDFTNYVVADAMFYMQAGFRKKIQAATADAVNGAVARFKHHRPDFRGDISIIAHSLGGAVMFDILRNQSDKELKLSFCPAAFFAAGSPISMFIHASGDVPEPSLRFDGGTRFFNIFHPLDPVAYRIESLLDIELAKVPPERIPADGGYGLQGLWNWTKSSQTVINEETKSKLQALQLNAGARIDWQLPEEMSYLPGNTAEVMRAFSSHSCYVTSKDFTSFVCSFAKEIFEAKKGRQSKGSLTAADTDKQRNGGGYSK